MVDPAGVFGHATTVPFYIDAASTPIVGERTSVPSTHAAGRYRASSAFLKRYVSGSGRELDGVIVARAEMGHPAGRVERE
jgi:hypothetical protein